MKFFNRLMLIAMSLALTGLMDVRAEDAPATPATPAATTPATPETKPKAKPRRVVKKKIQRKNAAASKKSAPLPTTEAATSQDSGLQSWLKDLKKRLEKSRAKQNQIVAVAAVRGNETPEAPPLYWKGMKAEGPTQMPELGEFETAVDLAMKGDPSAREKLTAFIAANPNSSLTADAQETLSRLPAETAIP